MDFFALLKKRHSARKFRPKEIVSRKLKKLFQSINSAPSAGNMQNYLVCVVREKEKRRLVAEACFGQGFVGTAPVILVFFADAQGAMQKYGARGAGLYSIQDATIAASYAQLSATALGLASCWVGAFEEERLQKLFNLPRQLKPVAVVPIGFSSEKPAETPRRQVQEIFREDSVE